MNPSLQTGLQTRTHAPTLGPAPLLLHVFPSFAVGGAQVRFTTLANHFGPRFRHAIVAMDGNHACRERLDPTVAVTFPAIDLRRGDTLGNIRRMRAALREWRPSRMITGNWGSIDWAIANRLAIVPHLHVEDGFGPDERTTQLPRRVWTRRLMLAGRTVVVPSLTLRRIALETWRLAPARVRYVPNGIDLARFGPVDAAESPRDHLVIGTVAALRGEKNLGRLLRAFALAVGPAPAQLLIVGDGPDRAALAAEAARLGIADRVRWAGHIADPAALIRSLDVFAMSSDTEQMPLSLLEAMAAGLPVASTDVGDVAAMLPPEQRPLVVPREDEALGAALRRLLEDAGLRQQLGAANRARAVAAFDQQTMFAAWGALWQAG